MSKIITDGLALDDTSIISELRRNKNPKEIMEKLGAFYISVDNEISRGIRRLGRCENNIVNEFSACCNVSSAYNDNFYLEISELDEPFRNFDLLTKKIYQIINIIMLSKNSNSFKSKRKTEVSLNFEILEVLLGIDVNNKNEVDALMKRYKKSIDLLSRLNFHFYKKREDGSIQEFFIKFCNRATFGELTKEKNKSIVNKRVAKISLSDEYVKFCVSDNRISRKYTIIPTAIFLLKKTTTYGIAEALSRQYFDKYNIKHGTHNRASIESLLQYSCLSTERKIREENRDFRNRLILPILRALVELEAYKIIEIRGFSKKCGISLFDDEEKALNLELERIRNNMSATESAGGRISFNTFRSLYIQFDICNVPSEYLEDIVNEK